MLVSGMPDISMFQFDIPEVVQYRVNFVEERDGSGLVDRMQGLVQHPDEQDKLLRVGRKHVQVDFECCSKAGALQTFMNRSSAGDSVIMDWKLLSE